MNPQTEGEKKNIKFITPIGGATERLEIIEGEKEYSFIRAKLIDF